MIGRVRQLSLRAYATLNLGFKITYTHMCIWTDQLWRFLP